MLVEAPISAGSVNVNPRVIAMRAKPTNTTWYTVPAGKKFIGWVANNGNFQPTINGVEIWNTSTTNQPPDPIDLVLPEGTTVGCGATYASWSLVGVEINNGTTLDQI
jgi:hypothetical protein